MCCKWKKRAAESQNKYTNSKHAAKHRKDAKSKTHKPQKQMQQKNAAYPVNATEVLQETRGSAKWNSLIFNPREKDQTRECVCFWSGKKSGVKKRHQTVRILFMCRLFTPLFFPLHFLTLHHFCICTMFAVNIFVLAFCNKFFFICSMFLLLYLFGNFVCVFELASFLKLQHISPNGNVLDFNPDFIRPILHSVTCNQLVKLLLSHLSIVGLHVKVKFIAFPILPPCAQLFTHLISAGLNHFIMISPPL